MTITTTSNTPTVPAPRLAYGPVPGTAHWSGEDQAIEAWFVDGLGELDATRERLPDPWNEKLDPSDLAAAREWAEKVIHDHHRDFAVEEGSWTVTDDGHVPTLWRRRHTLLVDTLDGRQELLMQTVCDAERNLRLLSDPDAVLTYRNTSPEDGVVLEELYVPVRKVESVRHLVRLEEVPDCLGLADVFGGRRVHHTEPIGGGCTEVGHRNGVMTGEKRVTSGRDHVEVKLDCGHTRWPLLRVLRDGRSA